MSARTAGVDQRLKSHQDPCFEKVGSPEASHDGPLATRCSFLASFSFVWLRFWPLLLILKDLLASFDKNFRIFFRLSSPFLRPRPQMSSLIGVGQIRWVRWLHCRLPRLPFPCASWRGIGALFATHARRSGQFGVRQRAAFGKEPDRGMGTLLDCSGCNNPISYSWPRCQPVSLALACRLQCQPKREHGLRVPAHARRRAVRSPSTVHNPELDRIHA